jgi:hypothetical protein
MQEDDKMNAAASAGFEGIAQMLLEQKKLMDALEAENRELRRLLAELRRGVGVAVVIEGKTFLLANESNGSASSPNGQAALQSLQQGLPNAPAGMSPPPQANYPNQNGRGTGGQPSVNNEKRESNNARSPLADSFVL